MGWRGTIVLAGLVLVAGMYLWYDTPATPPGPHGQPPRGHPAPRKVLAFEPGDVVGLELQRAGTRHTVQQQHGAWQEADEAAAIGDFLHTLSTLGVLMDIAASPAELADYGLDPPLGVITLHLQGQAQALVLHIGGRNPATTGVYVRLGENGMVALAGALVEWEFDKLFKRLGRGD